VATTQLFVELLIIGIGAAIWLGFLLAVILDLPLGSPLPDLSSTYLIGLSSVAYVVGIVVDRLAWSVFRSFEDRQRDRVFGPIQEPSVQDRERYVLENSSGLRPQVAYNRSRLRICRSWILNFVLTAICAGAWAIQQRASVIAAIAAVAVALSGLTAYTANRLARDHYLNIQSSYDFLAKARGIVPTAAEKPQ
jgi:hypothetical protein